MSSHQGRNHKRQVDIAAHLPYIPHLADDFSFVGSLEDAICTQKCMDKVSEGMKSGFTDRTGILPARKLLK
jgi:hypothetical protein